MPADAPFFNTQEIRFRKVWQDGKDRVPQSDLRLRDHDRLYQYGNAEHGLLGLFPVSAGTAGVLEHPGVPDHDGPVYLVIVCDVPLRPVLPENGDPEGRSPHLPQFLLCVPSVRLRFSPLYVPSCQPHVRHFLRPGGDDPGLDPDPALVSGGQRPAHGTRRRGQRSRSCFSRRSPGVRWRLTG